VFTRITTGRASETIADQIRAAILEGRLEAGDRLAPERELAEQFGVSRVTVRDALRTLEAAGLVEVRVGASGGAFVRKPPSSVLGQGIVNMLVLGAVTPDQIAEARLIIELGTVTLAVERATDEDIDALRGLVERLREHYDRDVAREFHQRLAEAAHNEAVRLLSDSFGDALSMHAVRVREPSDWSHRQTVREHGDIVRAIEKRDVDKARAVIARHLTRGTNLGPRLAKLLRGER
jgi:DNA-binding FadR family transcriptional regulator